MKRQSTVGVCFLMLLAGCDHSTGPSAVTESSTYKSPAASGTKFWHVAVWAKAELATRQQMEVGTLHSHRVDATPSLQVWPIDASGDDIQATIKAGHGGDRQHFRCVACVGGE